MQKCTIPLELGAWRGPYHAHCPSRWCRRSQRRHRAFDRKGVSDRVDELCEYGTNPGKTSPLWGTLALQPGPRFQQIGDGDGGASPSPDKSGTGTGERPRPRPNRGRTPRPRPRTNRGRGRGRGPGCPCPVTESGGLLP